MIKTGDILSNRYEILAKVGDGGMALVYSAKDLLLNRIVAVKVLREQYADDSEFVGRFQREAQAAASLSHPNVVNIYDVGETGGTHYIVMEFVEGKNLSEIIKEQGTVDQQFAVDIVIQICSALAHAHEHGIVHRDIKPHNILLTGDNRVKVTDFGIAAVSSLSITQTGMVLGSVLYFSPEQARGTKVEAQSDLYSLGVVLYEMLTGRVPFRGDTPISIALKHIQDDPVPPHSINPDISRDLEAIILKLLSKQASERYQSAYQLSAVLAKLNLDDMINKTVKLKTPSGIVLDGEGQSNSVPKSKKVTKGPNRFIRFILIVALLGLLFLAGMFVISNLLFKDDVRVPDIAGISINEAERILSEHNLRLSVEVEVFDNQMPENYVISQDPKPDRMVKEDRVIFVRVSKGIAYESMPSVIGLTSREARLSLTQAGFILGEEIREVNPDYPADTVIDQIPAPHEEVALGTSVNLVINGSREVTGTVILPDFRNQDLSAVKAELDRVGLQLGNVWAEYNTTVPENLVIEQNPPADTEIEIGWTVDLIYSLGMPGGSSRLETGDNVQRWTTESLWHQNVIRIEVPEGPPQEVVILVVDDFGAREVYRKTHEGGTSISEIVEGRGDQARVQVYIGGRIFTDQLFAE